MFVPLKESRIYVPLLLYGGRSRAAHTKMRLPYSVSVGAAGEKNCFHPYLSHTESKNGHTSPRCVRELQSVGGLRAIGMSFYTHIIHYKILLEKKKCEKKSDKLIPKTTCRLTPEGYLCS